MSRFCVPLCVVCAGALGFVATTSSAGLLFRNQDSVSARGQSAATSKQGTSDDSAAGARLTRGKKLVLKDGNFQLVREYERKGERVRYFSLERGAWEEIPAAMVDWDATAKAQADSDKASAALLGKIHAQEEATKIETVLDVDASLQVAPGVFLPPGEGMFAIEGKSVTPLVQVGSQEKTDKKTFLKQVLSPIPIVPGKRNVEIPGAKAKTRISSSGPEFYLREAPPDPDRESPVVRSSRPGLQPARRGHLNGDQMVPTCPRPRAVTQAARAAPCLPGCRSNPERSSVQVPRWASQPSQGPAGHAGSATFHWTRTSCWSMRSRPPWMG